MNDILQGRIETLIKNKYEIWNTENLYEMAISIVMELGNLIDGCYYYFNQDNIEIMYDKIDDDIMLEIYYDTPHAGLVPVFDFNSNEYDLHYNYSIVNTGFKIDWLDKFYSLYFEANKPYLYCEL